MYNSTINMKMRACLLRISGFSFAMLPVGIANENKALIALISIFPFGNMDSIALYCFGRQIFKPQVILCRKNGEPKNSPFFI